jgi:hypothetical protein
MNLFLKKNKIVLSIWKFTLSYGSSNGISFRMSPLYLEIHGQSVFFSLRVHTINKLNQMEHTTISSCNFHRILSNTWLNFLIIFHLFLQMNIYVSFWNSYFHYLSGHLAISKQLYFENATPLNFILFWNFFIETKFIWFE